MTVSITMLRNRLRMMEERFYDFTKQAEQNGGRLQRDEIWRKDYLSFPYLIGAPDERVAQRFRDVFINQSDLGDNAKIGLLPVDAVNSFMPKFTHLLEEYGARSGGPPDKAIIAARKPILRYFENGDPIAVRMFRGYTPPASHFVVKYGQRKFLEQMLHTGRLRISPASYYNDGAHNEAVKDDEIHRTFYIPTFQERLKGNQRLLRVKDRPSRVCRLTSVFRRKAALLFFLLAFRPTVVVDRRRGYESIKSEIEYAKAFLLF